MTGKTYGTLEVIYTQTISNLKCKCTKCGQIDMYKKHHLLKGARCRACVKTKYNMIGNIYTTLTVLSEEPLRKVKCQCSICHTIDLYDKTHVKTIKMCRECRRRDQDMVGKQYGTLTVTENAKNKLLTCICNNCHKSDKYGKQSLSQGRRCKHCGEHGNLKSRLGETHGKLTVVSDPGKRVVICKCKLCGHKNSYAKQDLGKYNTVCKTCDAAHNIINRVGETYRNLTIIEEMGKNRVKCKCIECNHICTYNKNSLILDRVDCNNCGTSSSAIGRIGKIHGTLKIIEDLGNNRVICNCLKCNNKHEYPKSALIMRGSICKTCDIQMNYKNKIINNVKAIEFNYTGRDGLKYYNVMCLACGEVINLNENEIPIYTCTN